MEKSSIEEAIPLFYIFSAIMEEIIYSQNINSTIFCYSMDFSGISKQNAHGERNVLPKMFVGRW